MIIDRKHYGHPQEEFRKKWGELGNFLTERRLPWEDWAVGKDSIEK